MKKAFIINPAITIVDLKDEIEERISKTRGVLNCLMFAIEFAQGDDELDHSSAYHALWAMDGFLNEINVLRQKLDEVTN